MITDEYCGFAQLVLGLHQQIGYGREPSKYSFLNMLLEDFLLIANLTESFDLPESNNQRTLARCLACFSFLFLGAEALTQQIIDKVWGGENEVHRYYLR